MYPLFYFLMFRFVFPHTETDNGQQPIALLHVFTTPFNNFLEFKLQQITHLQLDGILKWIANEFFNSFDYTIFAWRGSCHRTRPTE